MHIQNIASCIDFVKATCFRLDKAFSKASLRFLHSSLVSTKPLRSFVEVAGFEVESAQPLRCYSPKVEPLSSASVEFRIKKVVSHFQPAESTTWRSICGWYYLPPRNWRSSILLLSFKRSKYLCAQPEGFGSHVLLLRICCSVLWFFGRCIARCVHRRRRWSRDFFLLKSGRHQSLLFFKKVTLTLAGNDAAQFEVEERLVVFL